jgi:pimeloyl-ACP methyl ester carboxylesterase
LTQLRLPGGRTLGVDDVGDPHGTPVVYLHGTPDSRLARHPDDGLAGEAGVRLLAVDRPGYGATSASPPGADPSVFADDVAAMLDHLGIDRAALLTWSGGALHGLAATSAQLADRSHGLHVVAGIVPREAYDDPTVRAAAGHRLGLVDLAEGLPPEGLIDLAEGLAPLQAPQPCDHAVALEHQREQRSPADQMILEQVPGAIDRMADALVEAVRHGLAGVRTDIETEVRRGALDLTTITLPVHLWYGTADTVTPPALGEWYAKQLPHAHLTLVPDASHYLPFTHWPDLLTALSP